MILNKVTKHLELNKYIKNVVKCYVNKASVDGKSLCVSSIPSISILYIHFIEFTIQQQET